MGLFRDRAGIALPALIAGLVGWGTLLPIMAHGVPISDREKNGVIATICSLLEHNYVYADTGKNISGQLRADHDRGKYASIRSAEEFAAQLDSDLKELGNDKHLGVIYDPEWVRQIKEQGPEDEYLTEEMVDQEKARNFGFKRLEILNGNIGYLDLRSFFHPKHAGETAVAALNYLSNCRALIIDLRNNGGGWGTMVTLLSSYFLDNEEGVHLMSAYWRPEDMLYQSWTLPYVPGKLMTGVPIYILTSRSTFSAAEEFCYSMKQLKRAILVGERTRGGAHPVASKVLNDQLILILPEWTSFHPVTKSNWEGVGIAPDIEAAAEKAFDVAYAKALTQLRDSAASVQERALYQWHFDGFNARANPAAVDAALMRSYAGKYGTLNITYEDGVLYYQRGDRMKHKMIPMSETLFLVDEESDLRIRLKREGGMNRAVIVLYSDGRSTEYVRE